MRRFGLFLLLITVSKQLSVSKFNVPNFVRAGDDATLQCGYELKSNESDKSLFLKWWWSPRNGSSDKRSLLYQRIAGHPPDALGHNIEIVQDDDILLRNVTVKDSGIYECEVSETVDEVHKYQLLIVYNAGNGVEMEVSTIEDGPDADDNEDVFVTCGAVGVAPYPGLTISVDGEEINATDVVVSSTEDLYDVYNNVTLSSDVVAGQKISCLLSFSNFNISDESFLVTEIYNGSGFTSDIPTEMASTEANESVEINSQAGIFCSWLLVILSLTFSYNYYNI